MPKFMVQNGPMQTTGSFAGVATGTSRKTMLQIKPSATLPLKIKEWGFSLNGNSQLTPGTVELVEVDVAATVTAIVLADITKLDGEALAGGDPTTNLIQVGTTATGYTSSGEGTITTTRNLDSPIYAPPTNWFYKQFPLGDEPLLNVAKFTRIIANFGTSVSMICYIKLVTG